MRRLRFLATLALAAAVLPLSWWRSELPKTTDQDRRIRLVDLSARPSVAGPFRLAGAWEIASGDRHFGGFSALLALPGNRFVAGSDTGRKLEFSIPGSDGWTARLSQIGRPGFRDKFAVDLEALTLDPASGTVWGSYEVTNSVTRFTPDLVPETTAKPRGLQAWQSNTGPETLVRFPDGRFLAVAEAPLEWLGQRHSAVLFAGDPAEGAREETVTLIGIQGYRPVDAVAVGDGRALVLFRKLLWRAPPGFATAIGLVDIDVREPDGSLVAKPLAFLGNGFPAENYEGIAITGPTDQRRVWLISDDNLAKFQRTLLLELAWDEGSDAKRRAGFPARP